MRVAATKLASSVRVTLQGCLRHVREDGNAVYETLQEIKGDMIIAGLKFNKTTHALFVEVYLLTGHVEVGFCPPVRPLLLRVKLSTLPQSAPSG